MNGADILVEMLIGYDVDTVFGVPGDTNVSFAKLCGIAKMRSPMSWRATNARRVIWPMPKGDLPIARESLNALLGPVRRILCPLRPFVSAST